MGQLHLPDRNRRGGRRPQWHARPGNGQTGDFRHQGNHCGADRRAVQAQSRRLLHVHLQDRHQGPEQDQWRRVRAQPYAPRRDPAELQECGRRDRAGQPVLRFHGGRQRQFRAGHRRANAPDGGHRLLQRLPRQAGAARRRTRRHPVLRDVPQPRHHRRQQRQCADALHDGAQDPLGQAAEGQPRRRQGRRGIHDLGLRQQQARLRGSRLPAGPAQLHQVPHRRQPAHPAGRQLEDQGEPRGLPDLPRQQARLGLARHAHHPEQRPGPAGARHADAQQRLPGLPQPRKRRRTGARALEPERGKRRQLQDEHRGRGV